MKNLLVVLTALLCSGCAARTTYIIVPCERKSNWDLVVETQRAELEMKLMKEQIDEIKRNR